VGRTIYLQAGDAPSDDDALIGVMDTPELAQIVVAAVNSFQESMPLDPADQGGTMTDPERLAKMKARSEHMVAEERRLLMVLGTRLERPSHDQDVLWLVGEAERLRDLLADLEWAGPEERGEGERCPICGSPGFIYPQVHEPGCRLAAELNPPTSPVPPEGV
jgi:hypothetical protein